MYKSRAKKNMVKLTGIALLAALAAGIGGTAAVIHHKVDMRNEIATPKVEVSVTEDLEGELEGGDKPKEVKFTNNGTADIFLRVSYAESWRTAVGDGTEPEQLLNNTYDEESKISVVTKHNGQGTFLGEPDWVYIDGWYYYTKILPAGRSTEPVLKSVDFSKLTGESGEALADYQDAGYELYFQTEAVQVSDELAVSLNAAKELFGEDFIPYETGDRENEIDAEEWLKGRLNAYIDWAEPEGGGN